MNRRQMMTSVAMAGGSFVVGSAFTAPACDAVSKDKAVRYAGLTISYLKDILPAAAQLGGANIETLINKAIPQLEKLKAALEKTDIATAGNFFDTVTGILGQVANALFQLPDSGTKIIVMGILTAANVTLRTISLFIEAEAPAAPATAGVRRTSGLHKPSGSADAIRKAFEATRF